jgi:hypothetical protein
MGKALVVELIMRSWSCEMMLRRLTMEKSGVGMPRLGCGAGKAVVAKYLSRLLGYIAAQRLTILVRVTITSQ